MTNYAAIVNLRNCVDCRACVVACKDEHALNEYQPYSAGMPFNGQKWIRVENLERGSYPKAVFESYPVFCMHCDNAPCITAATGGAVYKRPDGIVIIDPVKSRGQKQIVSACPYGAVFWNDEKQIPQKCTLCVHRLEQGLLPRCMMACPADAIKIGIYEDLMRDQTAFGQYWPEPYHPEFKTQSRVLYIGLPKTFITGQLVDAKGECLSGADIAVADADTKAIVLSTKSDAFGDFWFDNLATNKNYTVTIVAAGQTKNISVSLDKDTNLGDIQF